jgi:hypothetical protein
MTPLEELSIYYIGSKRRKTYFILFLPCILTMKCIVGFVRYCIVLSAYVG